MSDDRYALRREDNGSWTVYDTTLPPDGENRIMYGISQERARQYVEHLNKVRSRGAQSQPPTEDVG